MIHLIHILAIIFVLNSLISYRNELINQYRLYSIDILENYKGQQFYEKIEEWKSYGTHEQMLFDWRKWKYEDFYPDWE